MKPQGTMLLLGAVFVVRPAGAYSTGESPEAAR